VVHTWLGMVTCRPTRRAQLHCLRRCLAFLHYQPLRLDFVSVSAPEGLLNCDGGDKPPSRRTAVDLPFSAVLRHFSFNLTACDVVVVVIAVRCCVSLWSWLLWSCVWGGWGAMSCFVVSVATAVCRDYCRHRCCGGCVLLQNGC
jgi:hypothetical protein